MHTGSMLQINSAIGAVFEIFMWLVPVKGTNSRLRKSMTGLLKSDKNILSKILLTLWRFDNKYGHMTENIFVFIIVF